MDIIATEPDKKKNLTQKLFMLLMGFWFWGLVFGAHLIGLTKASSNAKIATGVVMVLVSVAFSIYFFYSLINLFKKFEAGRDLDSHEERLPEIV